MANRDALDARDLGDPARGSPPKRGSRSSARRGIPCGRINSVAQALSDPHTVAREMVRTVQHPTAGDVKMLGIPFRFSDTPASVRRAPPTLGQHTEQVLRDVLELSDARIDELRAAKVI